jgi:hypothetical protein
VVAVRQGDRVTRVVLIELHEGSNGHQDYVVISAEEVL